MSRRGLSLVELVAALALASLLLVAMSGVLVSLAKLRRASAVTSADERTFEAERILWNDLALARHVAWVDGALRLSLPSQRHDLAEGPTVVRYQTVPWEADRSRWIRAVYVERTDREQRIREQLVRQQTLLYDVEAFVAHRVDERGLLQPLPAKPGPVPRTLAVELRPRATSRESSPAPVRRMITAR